MLEDGSWSRRPVAEVAVAEAVAEAAVAEAQRLEPGGKIKQSQSLKRKVDREKVGGSQPYPYLRSSLRTLRFVQGGVDLART